MSHEEVVIENATAPAPPAAPIDMTMPKTIVPKPDKLEHEKTLAALQSEIKKYQTRMDAIRTEIDEMRSGHAGQGTQMAVEKTKYTEMKTTREKLFEERNHITAQLQTLLGKRDEQTKSHKALRSEIKFTTEDEINKEIESLRRKQETSSMSLTEEKKLIKEIENLQQSRKLVAKYASSQSSSDATHASLKELRLSQTIKNKEIDELTAKMAEQKIIMDKLYSENSGDKGVLPALLEERKKCKALVDEKFNAMRALRTKFKEDNDVYYENVRKIREIRKEEKRLEEERQKEEYAEKMKEYEKEMAKLHPYQEEMDLCDATLKYLQASFARELKVTEAVTAEDLNRPKVAVVEMDGMKPLKREEEDFIVLGGAGKSKKSGGGEKKNKKKKETAITLPMAQIESFSLIGLLPPTTTGAVKDSIAAIKERKEYLAKQTVRLDKKSSISETPAATAAAAPASMSVAAPNVSSPLLSTSSPKVAKTSKNHRKFDMETSDFPSLG